MARQYGYCMAGTEASIEERLAEVANRFGGEMNYVEIGIAEGQTLLAVADFAGERGWKWNVLGIDILNGKHFNPHRFLNNTHRNITIANEPCKIYDGSISVWLCGSPYAVKFIPFAIQYALVDGCHCTECTMHDFVAIEPKIAVGGYVAFHDAADQDQGNEPQCRPDRRMNVPEALRQLGLDPKITKRLGWVYAGSAGTERTTVWFRREAKS